MYAVDVNRVVVKFEKVNVKVKLSGPTGAVKVVFQVVMVTSIGLEAGACAGTRDTRDTTHAAITSATNAALTVNGLLKTTLGIISA
jgi:hypothetical protein